MGRFRFIGHVLFPLAAFLLAGCATAGPDYKPPEASVPGGWNSASAEKAARLDSGAIASWWSTLNDPLLTALIERAVPQNLDIQAALARIEESRARLGISGAGRFPALDASGAARFTRGSEETGSTDWRKSYSAGLDASWELDLFGGIRRSVEAARADLGAAEEELRGAHVSLAAEVALRYVDVRTIKKRLSIASANLGAQEDTYKLVKALYDSGLKSELDLKQAKYNLENTRSQVPALRSGLEEAMNRLAVLLGRPPGALHGELSGDVPIPAAGLEIAVGVPADAIRRRPDVRRAERELAAQTARVGVAASELYPKLRLSGSIGLEALSPGGLFSLDGRTYGTGSVLSWPVFHAGALRQNVQVQGARQEQALIRYEAAVLSALEEVENAMTAYAQEQLRRQALIDAAQAASDASRSAKELYFSGLSDFQNVLDAERTLLSVQDRVASAEGNVTAGLIRIYKALGGGWPHGEDVSGGGENNGPVARKEK